MLVRAIAKSFYEEKKEEAKVEQNLSQKNPISKDNQMNLSSLPEENFIENDEVNANETTEFLESKAKINEFSAKK